MAQELNRKATWPVYVAGSACVLLGMVLSSDSFKNVAASIRWSGLVLLACLSIGTSVAVYHARRRSWPVAVAGVVSWLLVILLGGGYLENVAAPLRWVGMAVFTCVAIGANIAMRERHA